MALTGPSGQTGSHGGVMRPAGRDAVFEARPGHHYPSGLKGAMSPNSFEGNKTLGQAGRKRRKR
jgi:hypothetical protein